MHEPCEKERELARMLLAYMQEHDKRPCPDEKCDLGPHACLCRLCVESERTLSAAGFGKTFDDQLEMLEGPLDHI